MKSVSTTMGLFCHEHLPTNIRWHPFWDLWDICVSHEIRPDAFFFLFFSFTSFFFFPFSSFVSLLLQVGFLLLVSSLFSFFFLSSSLCCCFFFFFFSFFSSRGDGRDGWVWISDLRIWVWFILTEIKLKTEIYGWVLWTNKSVRFFDVWILRDEFEL